MGNVEAKCGDLRSNSLDTAGSTRISRSRSQLQGERAQDKKKHARARLLFMGNTHMQFGDCIFNNLGAAGGTQFSRSRSQLQGQRTQGMKNMPVHTSSSYRLCTYNLETVAAIVKVKQMEHKFADGQTDGRTDR